MGELMEGAMQQAAQPLRQVGEEAGTGRLKHGGQQPFHPIKHAHKICASTLFPASIHAAF